MSNSIRAHTQGGIDMRYEVSPDDDWTLSKPMQRLPLCLWWLIACRIPWLCPWRYRRCNNRGYCSRWGAVEFGEPLYVCRPCAWAMGYCMDLAMRSQHPKNRQCSARGCGRSWWGAMA